MSHNLKSKTTKALLWGSIDKVYSQVCYAVTGVILANILFAEDYGLVAIINVFTAFATIFIDGGFSLALVQRKTVTNKDYSTIFFFNIAISGLLYIILFFCAPLIADYYGDERLILLSRIMFLNIIFLSLGLVQSSMLMKQMDQRKVAFINAVSLTISSLIALSMALMGFGVWTLVVQALSLSFIRSLILWISGKWLPLLAFSKSSLKSIFYVGSGILLTSFVRTFFQNIYTLIIGGYSMKDLGYYSQADRWSKMGATSLSQSIGNAAFPALSSIQDDKERMRNVFGKINRMTSYLAFPVFIWLIVMTEPVFHCLFKTKWDPSILLFQLLLLKGLFFVFISLLNNYLMAAGRTRIIFYLEVIKDVIALIIIFITIRISILALVIGQVVVEIIHYIITMSMASKLTGYTIKRQAMDILPYAAIGIAISFVLWMLGNWIANDYLLVVVQGMTGIGLYLVINKLLNSKIQQEVFGMLAKKKPAES